MFILLSLFSVGIGILLGLSVPLLVVVFLINLPIQYLLVKF